MIKTFPEIKKFPEWIWKTLISPGYGKSSPFFPNFPSLSLNSVFSPLIFFYCTNPAFSCNFMPHSGCSALHGVNSMLSALSGLTRKLISLFVIKWIDCPVSVWSLRCGSFTYVSWVINKIIFPTLEFN